MKKIQIHGEPSFYRKHGKDMVQVTVLVGKDANQRSETRHAEFKNGKYVGLNTDHRAIPLNQLYEAELADAQSNFSVAKARLIGFKERMSRVEDGTAEPEETAMSAIDTVMFGDFKTKLAAHIEGAKNDVAIAETALNDAETKLDIVRRELPLMMEFYRN